MGHDHRGEDLQGLRRPLKAWEGALSSRRRWVWSGYEPRFETGYECIPLVPPLPSLGALKEKTIWPALPKGNPSVLWCVGRYALVVGLSFPELALEAHFPRIPLVFLRWSWRGSGGYQQGLQQSLSRRSLSAWTSRTDAHVAWPQRVKFPIAQQVRGRFFVCSFCVLGWLM